MPLLPKATVGTSIPTQDIERAKAFYRDKLGLTPTDRGVPNPTGNVYYVLGDGTFLFLFESMGRPSGDHTQLAFEVGDLNAVVDELIGNGLVFEQYDYPDLKTDERGIVDFEDERAAWFKDSEGNLAVIVQRGLAQ